jgi:ubiquinone/menaquinone biosynthesis C-methylase UbiE
MAFYDSIAPGYDELYAEEQRIKLGIIKENLDIKNNDLLLDVGCGTGLSSDFDCEVIGIDPSMELLQQSNNNENDNKKQSIIKNAQKSKIFGTNSIGFNNKTTNKNNKVLGMAENIPFKDNAFDKVISVTAMHNFDDIVKGMQEMKRVGKNDFVFSILKKSAVYKLIEKEINENFNIRKIIDDKKDSIFICSKIFKQ